MTDRLLVEPLRYLRDARGGVVEPLSAAGIAEQRNVHAVVTLPGAVRGNHFHRRATEVLTVLGPAWVRTREAGEVRDFHVPPDEVWRFTIPPGVSHALTNPGNAPSFAVAFSTEVLDPARPDTFPDVLFEPGAPAPAVPPTPPEPR